jgi:DNA-binding CsgD family transcriptional regulator
MFKNALCIDVCTVFAFGSNARPTPLFADSSLTARRDQAWDLAREYANGDFRHDPIIRQNLGAATPVVYRLLSRQVRDSGYRRRFYDTPALQGKVGILGSIRGTAYYSNFYRDANNRPFHQGEIETLHELAGLMLKVLHRHHLATARAEDWRRNALGHLHEVFLSGGYQLTPREADVCAHILLGYSALAISLNLGISINTVTTHRKRAYAKLRVCSQNELFERYFTTVITP